MEEHGRSVFKRGSTTFFTSSLFFDKTAMKDVTTLYAFVRVADDFVDCVPQKKSEYFSFKEKYLSARCGDLSKNSIIDDFVSLQKRVGIEDEWIDGFFRSMEMDLNSFEYKSMEDVLGYIYGSAEVIGFCMVRILGLSQDSMVGAGKLGRAFQYINFLRDIDEDLNLKRQYLPKDVVSEYFTDGVLNRENIFQHKDVFCALMIKELRRYLDWQTEARNYFVFLPWRSRVAIATASNMYVYTAQKILKNPFIVFEKKVKPTKLRIIFEIIKNIFSV